MSNHSKGAYMYILEGNIGAGKSTFLKLLFEKAPEISIGYEPYGDWHKQGVGESLLAKFYSEPERWAYSMETFAMFVRVREHLKDQERTERFHVVERSIYSGHYCFALNSYQSGFMSTLEWNIYLEWFQFLTRGKCTKPSGFIYMRVSPDVAFERIKKRSRDGESSIPLSYLQQLHDCHENFLVHKKDIFPELVTVPVLVLECDNEFELDPKRMNVLANQVHSFVQTTTPVTQVIHDQYVNSL